MMKDLPQPRYHLNVDKFPGIVANQFYLTKRIETTPFFKKNEKKISE